MQLFAMNEECLVCASHQLAPIASLSFVHTARRCYRWCKDRESWRLANPPAVHAAGVWSIWCRNKPMFFC